MTKMELLRDDFRFRQLDYFIWQNKYGPTTCLPYEGIQMTAVDSYAGFESIATYDLTGSSITVHSKSIPQGADAEATIVLIPNADTDKSNRLMFHYENGSIYAQRQVGGVQQNLGNVPLEDNDWARIRESAGTVYWEYGNDGVNWTLLRSQTASFSVDKARVYFETGAFGPDAHGNWIIDLVNVKEPASHMMEQYRECMKDRPFGIFASPFPTGGMSAPETLERTVDKSFDMVSWFGDFGTAVPDGVLQAANKGYDVIYSLEPVGIKYADLMAGMYDTYLAGLAKTITDTYSVVERVNLAANPAYNTGGASKWYRSGTPTLPTTSQVAINDCPTGARYANNFVTVANTTDAGISNRGERGDPLGMVVTAGKTYTASIYVKATTAEPFTVSLSWRDAAGTYISETHGAVKTVTANGWTRVSATGVAPATAAGLWVYTRIRGLVAASKTFMLTSLLVEESAVVGTYFDGDTADTASTLYDWSGAQYATTSKQSRLIDSTWHIRMFPEMNGDWTPWSVYYTAANPDYDAAKACGFDTFDKFQQAWRYIVQKFRDANVPNVRWQFCVIESDEPYGDNAFENYWPGEAWVDEVSFDGYNWGNGGIHSWRPHDEVWQHPYKRLRWLAPNMTIHIPEFGSKESLSDDAMVNFVAQPGVSPIDPNNSKATWVRNMMNERQFRYLGTVSWFNIKKERDWRMDSSESSRKAFDDNFRGVRIDR